ncbi:MAG: cation:proton antiporter [Bacteroidaceae bacterium]|nr:cation:proton antiporter [Bacteroidaceae bacterium]
MNLMDRILTFLPITDPTWIFFIVLCIILFSPIIFTRLHIPHLVGLILAGAIIGEHGFNILARDSSFELFGKVGIYYIMFLAGLEMDLEGLKKNLGHGFTFGLFTVAIPFVFGFVAGIWLLSFSVPASFLMGCILASHTLVAYPIIGRYGLMNRQSVVISVTATMLALVFALMVLAIISGTLRGMDNVFEWMWLGLRFVLLIAMIFLIFPRIIRWFFRHQTDNIVQYIFVLAMVFLAAAVAEFCGIEGILGAFFCGLVFNRFIPASSTLMNRTEFVGNAIFIPYFLIGVGMLVNVKPMFTSGAALTVVIVMVVAGTLSKYLAAIACKRLFNYSSADGLMMFGLTEAHAAGALAMAMVGLKLEIAPGVQLVDNVVLDGIVMTILISCIISSICTDQAARKMVLETVRVTDDNKGDDEKIMVALQNPNNVGRLVEVGMLMMNHKLNRGLIAINAVSEGDEDTESQEQSRKMLAKAAEIAISADVRMQTQSRLAVNVTNGIIHAFKENDASEMIVGLHTNDQQFDGQIGLFNSKMVDNMSRQVVMVHLTMPANTLRRIVVAVPPKAEYETGFFRWLERLARMAQEIGCRIEFNGTEQTIGLIRQYLQRQHANTRAEYRLMESMDDLRYLASHVANDHLFVIVTSRPRFVSYDKSMERIPRFIADWVEGKSVMIIYPDQQNQEGDIHTFTDPNSNYAMTRQPRLTEWLSKWIAKIG